MSAFDDAINLFNQLKSALLGGDPPINSIKPDLHSDMLDPLRDALEIHAANAGLHSGGLPAGAIGSVLYNIDGTQQGWSVLAPGLVNQGLFLETSGANLVPVWKSVIPFISLAYESDGYAYTGVEISSFSSLYFYGKNIKVYSPQLEKHVYLQQSSSKTFKADLIINSPETEVYLVIEKTALAAASAGSNIDLLKVNTVTANHIVLLEIKSGTGTTSAQGSGLLQILANEYRATNLRYEEIAVSGGVATVDVSLYDKVTSRFYISHDSSFTVNTTHAYLLAEGKIAIRNSGASSITVTFSTSFSGSATIEAGETKIFYFFRRTDTSSVLTVIDLTAGVSGNFLTEVVEDLTPQLGGDLDSNGKRILESQGDDLASANNLTLDSTLNGNVYVVTGTTSINLIEDLDWQDGALITLQFTGVLTITHAATISGDYKPIHLAKGADYTTTSGDTINFRLINGEWWEVTNTKESGGGGARRVMKENGVAVADQDNVNYINNGTIPGLHEDPTESEIEVRQYFQNGLDVDLSAKQDRDVVIYNDNTGKIETVQVKPDLRFQPGHPEVISGLVNTTHTLLGTIQQKGYEVKGYINNDSAVAITGFVITDGTTNLFTPIDFIANEKGKKFTIPDSYFDPYNDKDFYYYVTTGNSANVTIYFTSILNSPE